MSIVGHKVALHVFHRPAQTSAARTGMLSKLRLLDSLIHPTLDKTVAYGWHEDRLWYAVAQRQGHTLEALVNKRALSLKEALDIFTPIARGLALLHERGIVHRHVSLSNIRLVQSGAKSSAQTIAQLCGFEGWLSGNTTAPQNPICVAPEVAKQLSSTRMMGGAPTPSEDVFSLGAALLYAMSAKESPKRRDDWDSFLGERAKAAPTISDARQLQQFMPLLNRSLSIDPQKRPNAENFAAYLDRLQPRAKDDKRAQQMMALVVALIATLSILTIAYFVRESRRDLIQEAYDATESQVLRQELEAERARSKALEKGLRPKSSSFSRKRGDDR